MEEEISEEEARILKAMEEAGLFHNGYSIYDPVSLRIFEGLNPKEFYKILCEAVNKLYNEKGLEFFVKEDRLNLRRNHFSPEETFEIGKIGNLTYPLRVKIARISDEHYQNGIVSLDSYFDDNRHFILNDLNSEHTSYLGTAKLLGRIIETRLNQTK